MAGPVLAPTALSVLLLAANFHLKFSQMETSQQVASSRKQQQGFLLIMAS
jgi:hypothetical protein